MSDADQRVSALADVAYQLLAKLFADAEEAGIERIEMAGAMMGNAVAVMQEEFGWDDAIDLLNRSIELVRANNGAAH